MIDQTFSTEPSIPITIGGLERAIKAIKDLGPTPPSLEEILSPEEARIITNAMTGFAPPHISPFCEEGAVYQIMTGRYFGNDGPRALTVGAPETVAELEDLLAEIRKDPDLCLRLAMKGFPADTVQPFAPTVESVEKSFRDCADEGAQVGRHVKTLPPSLFKRAMSFLRRKKTR